MDSDNTRGIAERIFNNPPGEPNSINLQLDESTIDFIARNGYNPSNIITEMLTMITLHGVELLFGHKNILLLSDNDVFLLKRYVRSYGFELKVRLESPTLLVIGFNKYY